MFRSMNTEERFAKGSPPQSTTSGHELASLRHDGQESSWFSMFSVVSRPAWSLLQKYVLGRSQTPALLALGRGQVQPNLDIENTLFGQIDNITSTSHHSPRLNVAYVHCQHDNVESALASGSGSLSWLTADSLGEIGIQSPAEKKLNIQQHVGYFATARNFVSQVLLNVIPTLENRRTINDLVQIGEVWSADGTVVKGRPSSNRWDRLLGTQQANSYNSEQNRLSNLSETTKAPDAELLHCGDRVSSDYCPSPQCCAHAVANTTQLFERSDDGKSMHNEHAGYSFYKGPTDNESLCMPRPESLPSQHQLPLDEQYSVSCHLVGPRAAIACSEVAVLTPDQDNGYSSLEEEHSNSRPHNMRPQREEKEVSETDQPSTSQGECRDCGSDREEPSEKPSKEEQEEEDEEQEEADGEEETDESPAPEQHPERHPEPSPCASPLQCQNKAIAYIIGSPCSGESESEDDTDQDGNEDDDGFDSEGSSQFSDSEELDDSDSEEDSDAEEADSETERLWNSLCQNDDPYNPRNFTASLRTTPRSCAAEEPPVPRSPPELSSSPPSSPSSSPAPLVSLESEPWEEACEADEAESLRLWSSFCSSMDPYNPQNFQAPLRTQETTRGGGRKVEATNSARCETQEAEERLDSGFSEAGPSSELSSIRSLPVKKVRFAEEVEEFYASGDEDRRGPWEEFARDRCRFQRRVQEVEECISYCLAPSFRLLALQRLRPGGCD